MWILILSLYSGQGVAMTTTEFRSKDACEVAGSSWAEQASSWSRKYICVKY